MAKSKKAVIWGYDDGYGDNKCIDEKGRILNFPANHISVPLVNDSKDFLKKLEEGEDLDFIRVTSDKLKNFYAVGKYALENGDGLIDVDKNKHMTKNSKVNLFASLGLLAGDREKVEVDTLAMALPAEYFTEERENFLKDSVIGTHNISLMTADTKRQVDKHITIKQILVTSQPQAAIYSQMLDDEGKLIDASLAEKFVLVVDIGFGTLCLLGLDNMDPSEEVKHTSMNGVSRVYEAFAKHVEAATEGRTIPTAKVPKYLSQESFHGVSLEPIKSAVFSDHADKIRSVVTDVAKDVIDELELIIFTGGGTELLKEHLVEAFSSIRTEKRFLERHDLVKGLSRLAKYHYDSELSDSEVVEATSSVENNKEKEEYEEVL